MTFINNFGYALVNNKGEYITNERLQYKYIVHRANNVYEVGVYNRKDKVTRSGLINNKGEILVPCEYDSVIPIDDFYVLNHRNLVDKNLNAICQLPFYIADYDLLNKQILCKLLVQIDSWMTTGCSFVINIKQKRIVLCIGEKIDESIVGGIENLLKILNNP